MEVVRDYTSARERAEQRPGRLYLEYLIDCPPCPRTEERRRRLDPRRLPAAAGQGRRGAGSTEDESPAPPARSLPATPTTEVPACPLVENGRHHHHHHQRQPSAEFQRRMSPFRRVRRPASATPMMMTDAGDSPPRTVIKPRPLRVDGHPDDHDPATDTTSADGTLRQVCSLQAMVRHRRTLSNSSSGSITSNLSLPDHEQHQQQQHEQVRTGSISSQRSSG